MSWKEFFRPTWIKIVLPCIFLILFFYSIFLFHSIYNGKKICEGFDKSNSSEELFKFLEVQVNLHRINKAFSIGHIFLLTDPFYPIPCEEHRIKEEFLNFFPCTDYYGGDKFLECVRKYTKKFEPYDEMIGFHIPYNNFSFSIPLILINTIFIFSEWYLLSCLIVWIFNKVRKR